MKLTLLSPTQRQILAKGDITDASTVLLTPPEEIAKKCRVILAEVQAILTTLCTAHTLNIRSLDEIDHRKIEVISTGDEGLDDCIGGGFKTGILWDICGESGAGKTQLALQLSLLVQIPKNLGGLLGSACYLTTNSELPTKRLVELSERHLLLSPTLCSLDDVQTMRIASPDMLIHILSHNVPELIETRTRHTSKPVKLLVLDSLTALFKLEEKTSATTLTERAKKITEISSLLHSLASTHGIAIVVLTEVTDVFHRSALSLDDDPGKDITYYAQAQLFNRTDTVPGESKKEAGLGLVWANQLNVRLMMSRTVRRRYLPQTERAAKRRRVDTDGSRAEPFLDEPVLVRRLSVVFSSVGTPGASVDFLVAREGLVAITEEGLPVPIPPPPDKTAIQVRDPNSDYPVFGLLPDHVGEAPSSSLDNGLALLKGDDVLPADEEDRYWQGFDELEDAHTVADDGT